MKSHLSAGFSCSEIVGQDKTKFCRVLGLGVGIDGIGKLVPFIFTSIYVVGTLKVISLLSYLIALFLMNVPNTNDGIKSPD